MVEDKQAIRNLIEAWHRATAEGDVEKILPFMSEDAVFLVAGQPPMRGRAQFEAGLRKLVQTHRIESKGEIQEIEVSGNLAYCWNQLDVTVQPIQGGGASVHRSGPTLTIFRKSADGTWMLHRDANLLSVAK